MLPVLFAATLFLGAALLFLVQPLVGKLLLPLVGGSPGVWNTCMVFFQVLLLGGYLYAHRSTGKLGVRRQALVHLVLIAGVLVAFRIAYVRTGSPVPVVTSLLPDDSDNPIFGLVALLGAAVGIPFFVLSTTSPILQRWFATTGCRSAKDPYFLYAASNAGSLLGLLGYPLLLEPRLTLAEQQWVFAGGLCGYVAMVLVCAVPIMRKPGSVLNGDRHGGHAPETASGLPRPESRITPRRIGRWVFLAALPSSLLLGVTTHVSNTLAPVPLLWAVPLSLYLISFILVFARWPDAVHRGVGHLTPFLILFVALSLLLDAAEPFALVGALHLGAFFGVCLVCHGELAKDRPPAEHLTAFYFWLSVGGVIGGVCNGLIAPIVFQRLGMVEYPLALILAAAVRPRSDEPPEGPQLRVADVVLVLAILGISVGLVLTIPRYVSVPPNSDAAEVEAARLLRGGLMFGLPAVAACALVRRPARYALALGALFVAGTFDVGVRGETLHMERNFFGVVRVSRSPDGKFTRLMHGTTVHGQQRADEGDRPRPLTYYYERGPVGHLFANLAQQTEMKPKKPVRVGVVGLGIGAVAHYAEPGQRWTFFEIDPAVVRIAQNPEYFRFLSGCRADAHDVVLGDARRQLAKARNGEFDLIIIDAFSSDAIPVHLLTREAIALYVHKLSPHGVLAIHVTNQHLDIPPLVARLAVDHSPPLSLRFRRDMVHDNWRAEGASDSEWMILAQTDDALGTVAWDGYWDRVEVVPGPVWRDDFANLLRLWRKHEPN